MQRRTIHTECPRTLVATIWTLVLSRGAPVLVIWLVVAGCIATIPDPNASAQTGSEQGPAAATTENDGQAPEQISGQIKIVAPTTDMVTTLQQWADQPKSFAHEPIQVTQKLAPGEGADIFIFPRTVSADGAAKAAIPGVRLIEERDFAAQILTHRVPAEMVTDFSSVLPHLELSPDLRTRTILSRSDWELPIVDDILIPFPDDPDAPALIVCVEFEGGINTYTLDIPTPMPIETPPPVDTPRVAPSETPTPAATPESS